MRSAHRYRTVAVLACTVACVAVLPVGVAKADCSGAGDFGAGAGCPPPGDTSGGSSGESWPPTAVDWPPSQTSDAGDATGGGGGSKAGGPTPIVLPDGREPASSRPVVTTEPSTSSAPPTPIVPVGAPDTGPTATAIVMPTSPTS